jgi:hypothetical protein
MAKQTDKSKRPQCDKPEFGVMPAELVALPHWVLWRYEWRDDKTTPGKGSWTKVPYRTSGGKASSTGPDSWSAFALAVNAFGRGRYDGIGFVFTDTPYSGVDLDACITHDVDAAEFRITPFASRVIERLQTYTELSPSKTGLHAIGMASDMAALKTELDGNEIEVYSTGRYFTFTGLAWHDSALPVRDIHSDISDIVAKIRARKAGTSPMIDVDERLRMAFNADPKILSLFNGSTLEYAGDDSRADFALCRKLARYADNRPDLLDSMFRKSKLFRAKWDERRGDNSYGQQTISKAIENPSSGLGQRSAAMPKLSSYDSRKPQRYSVDDLWDAAMAYRRGEFSEGVKPGYDPLARAYRPRKGLLSIIIGDPGSGKSTMVDTWAHFIAKNYGWQFTFASFETQPIERHILDLCQIHLAKPTFAFVKDEAGVSIAATDAEMEMARKEIRQWFRFLGPQDDELDLNSILSYVEDDIKDFGVSGFVLDPWSELDQTRNLYETQTQFIEQELRKLRHFTRGHDLHTWLIVHPTKAGENRKDGRPTLYSANGSSHFYNKADFGLVVHVHANKKTTLYVDKVRFGELGERDAEIDYIYDVHKRCYLALAE